MNIYNDLIQLDSDKISKDYTFCILADIHNTKYSSISLYKNIINNIAKESPDAIFIAGDLIYSADDLLSSKTKDKLTFLLTKLSEIAPLYITFGNHDLKNGKINTSEDTLLYFESLELKNNNIHLVNNNSAYFDENISIAGFSPRFDSYYPKHKEKWIDFFIEDFINSSLDFSEDKFNILITHSPEIISKLEKHIKDSLKTTDNKKLNRLLKVLNKLSLVLCGHMHGGFVPKSWLKLGIIKSDKGFVASEGEKLWESRMRIVEKCRGVHDIFKSKIIISSGVTKWCNPNLLFHIIGKAAAKDITTIKIKKR